MYVLDNILFSIQDTLSAAWPTSFIVYADKLNLYSLFSPQFCPFDLPDIFPSSTFEISLKELFFWYDLIPQGREEHKHSQCCKLQVNTWKDMLSGWV